MYQKYLSGIGFAFVLAAVATVLGNFFPLIGSSVFAILLGILANNLFHIKKTYHAGLAYSGKKLLQYSIILLGFSMSIGRVSATGISSLKISILTILIAFISAYVVGRLLGMGKVLTTINWIWNGYLWWFCHCSSFTDFRSKR